MTDVSQVVVGLIWCFVGLTLQSIPALITLIGLAYLVNPGFNTNFRWQRWLVLNLFLATIALLRSQSEGAYSGLIILLRGNAVALSIWSWSNSLSLAQLLNSLNILHLPPVLSWVILLAIRYINTVALEWQNLFQAASARGFVLRINWQQLYNFGLLIGAFFVRSIDHSQNVYEAMCCRGFSPVSQATTVIGLRQALWSGRYELAWGLLLISGVIIMELICR